MVNVSKMYNSQVLSIARKSFQMQRSSAIKTFLTLSIHTKIILNMSNLGAFLNSLRN